MERDGQDSAELDLDSAADQLYALAPEDFGTRRGELVAQARANGDRALAAAIGKLRKPVRSAALLNALVRDQPVEIEELRQLAGELRQAHRLLRGSQLRGLSEHRQRLLNRFAALAREASKAGGGSLNESVLDQLRSTLEAAIADAGAEAAALSGRLTTALYYTGFGEVDVTDAVAVPTRRRHLRSVPPDGRSDDSDSVGGDSAGGDLTGGDSADGTGSAAGSGRPAGKRGSNEARSTGSGKAGSTGSGRATQVKAGSGESSPEATGSPAIERESPRQAAARARAERALRRAEREQAEVDEVSAASVEALRVAGQRLAELTEKADGLRVIAHKATAEADRAAAEADRATRSQAEAERRRRSAERAAQRAAATTAAAREKLVGLEPTDHRGG